jgi:glyoxylase-like metal-dependent hydrolase (beta-lactamase superfamily II)
MNTEFPGLPQLSLNGTVVRMNRSVLCLVIGAIAVSMAPSLVAAQQEQPRSPASSGAALEILTVGGDPSVGKVYLFAGTGANVIVQAGDEGAIVVDPGSAAVSDALIAEIRKLTTKPIRYVINTNGDADHIGGNANIAAAGLNFATPVPNLAGIGARGGGGGGGGGGGLRTSGAQIYAHEGVLTRLSAPSGANPPVPVPLWPTDTFFTAKKTLYFNGDPIELVHLPAAHTDGDILVWFRKNDVIAAGDVFTPDRFPLIDRARGGSVQGTLDALNRIIDMTIPRFNQQGGTMVIPGHGRLANESDVVEYRDMATIVRDRIQRMIEKKMTFEQVLAANPVLDYEGLYNRTPSWTKEMFMEAVYRDLSQSNTPRPSR